MRTAVARIAKLDRRFVLAVAAIWFLWGSTYLAMRVAVTEMPPFGLAGARFVVAGIAILGFARLRGEPGPSRRSWLIAIPAGILLFLGGNGFIVFAEEKMPSSVAATICATTPLVVAIVSAFRGEKPHRGEVIGMVLGILGVVVLGAGSSFVGVGARGLLIVLSPVTFALGSLLVTAEGKEAGLASSGAQMLTGGVSMLGVSALVGESLPLHIGPGAIFAWLWLVIFGSLIGFSAYVWLLRNARPSVAMSHAYVNPVVAVLLGALVGGEPLGFGTICATALIAAGVMSAAVLGPSRVEPAADRTPCREPRRKQLPEGHSVVLAEVCSGDFGDCGNDFAWSVVSKRRDHFGENEEDDDQLEELGARSIHVALE
ncbi:MAG: EamA family transporter [Polyangiaceae bacterium]|nr:EamA family transporter [Polyangiaceae bacterium]